MLDTISKGSAKMILNKIFAKKILLYLIGRLFKVSICLASILILAYVVLHIPANIVLINIISSEKNDTSWLEICGRVEDIEKYKIIGIAIKSNSEIPLFNTYTGKLKNLFASIPKNDDICDFCLKTNAFLFFCDFVLVRAKFIFL